MYACESPHPKCNRRTSQFKEASWHPIKRQRKLNTPRSSLCLHLRIRLSLSVKRRGLEVLEKTYKASIRAPFSLFLWNTYRGLNRSACGSQVWPRVPCMLCLWWSVCSYMCVCSCICKCIRYAHICSLRADKRKVLSEQNRSCHEVARWHPGWQQLWVTHGWKKACKGIPKRSSQSGFKSPHDSKHPGYKEPLSDTFNPFGAWPPPEGKMFILAGINTVTSHSAYTVHALIYVWYRYHY